MPHNKQPDNNASHSQAAGAYGQNAQKHAPDQRELEGRILLKSARMMQELIDGWDARTGDILEETLLYNRRLWVLFYDEALENNDEGKTNDLRSNIINLANFVFKRELEIMASPAKEKLNVLININKNVAAGLMTKQLPADTKAP